MINHRFRKNDYEQVQERYSNDNKLVVTILTYLLKYTRIII